MKRHRHVVGHVLLGPRAPRRRSQFPDPASDCYPDRDLHYVVAGSPRCVCGEKASPFKQVEPPVEGEA